MYAIRSYYVNDLVFSIFSFKGLNGQRNNFVITSYSIHYTKLYDLDAMKLQPCNPSFVTGRDAIIAADQATTGGENYCMIWEVFARRGLGVNASSGTNSGVQGIQDQTEDFTEPAPGPNCTLSVNYVITSYSIHYTKLYDSSSCTTTALPCASPRQRDSASSLSVGLRERASGLS